MTKDEIVAALYGLTFDELDSIILFAEDVQDHKVNEFRGLIDSFVSIVHTLQRDYHDSTFFVTNGDTTIDLLNVDISKIDANL